MSEDNLSFSQILAAARGMSPEQLEKLKEAIDEQEAPAKLAELVEALGNNLRALLQCPCDEDDLESILELADDLNDNVVSILEQHKYTSKRDPVVNYGICEDEADRAFSGMVGDMARHGGVYTNKGIRIQARPAEQTEDGITSADISHRSEQFVTKSMSTEMERDFIDRLSKHSELKKEFEALHACDIEDRKSLAERGIWRTQNGQCIKVRDMNDQHLVNSLKLLRRKAVEAMDAIHDGLDDEDDVDAIDAHSEARDIYGEQYEMLWREIVNRDLEDEL